MATVMFSVPSSSGDGAYTVIATDDGGTLRFTCNCAAGAIGQFCKHRQSLVDGKFNCDPPATEENKAALLDMLTGSWTMAQLAEIAAAERDLEAAKKRVRMLKGELGRRLADGV